MADEDVLDPHEQLAFEHELMTAANVFAQHWEKLGPSTGASCCAFILLAARTFVSAEDPMASEEFVALCAQLYERAQREQQSGVLVSVDGVEEPPVTMN